MRPAFRLILTVLLVLGLSPGPASADAKLGPAIRRLLGHPGIGQGPAGPPTKPGDRELLLLSEFIALDTESRPPRVHVRMMLDGPGRSEARGLGLDMQRGKGDLVSALVPLPRLRALTRLQGLEWIQASRRFELELDASLPLIGADTAGQAYGLTGAGVVVGIVDSGLDVTHGDFRDASGDTRVRFLWDQTDDCGSPPPGFTYGCYFDEAEINDFLDGIGTVSFPNADGHGTHVASVAAGDGSQTGNGEPAFQFAGVAPQAGLIAVKIFPEVGACSICSGGDALIFIEDRANALGQPFVANLSYGSDFGGHDGFEPDEIVIDTITGPGIPGKAVVKSAGNNRGVGIHASGTVITGTFIDHQFEVPAYTPVPGTFNDIIVWQMWHDGGDVFRVSIATPTLQAFTQTTANCMCSGGTNPGGACTTDADCPGGGACSGFGGVPSSEGVLIIDTTCEPTLGGSHRLEMEVDDQLGTPPAPGTWTFRVRGNSIAESGRYDMWIWLSSFGLGGQTSEWTAPDASQLITTPGNSLHVTTVGSFDSKTEWPNLDGDLTFYSPPLTLGALSSFSSPGDTRDGRLKPEINAPGQGIAAALAADAAPSVLGNPFDRLLVAPDAEHWVLAGTSFAAPHVTGAYALMLQVDPTLDANQLRDLLTGSAGVDGFTGTVPNSDWGHGKLDLQAALDNLFKPLPDLMATDASNFTASAIPQATSYDIFRTDMSGFDGTDYGTCLLADQPTPSFVDATIPPLGEAFGYTAAGEKDGIDGQLGQWSDGTLRPRPTCP